MEAVDPARDRVTLDQGTASTQVRVRGYPEGYAVRHSAIFALDYVRCRCDRRLYSIQTTANAKLSSGCGL